MIWRRTDTFGLIIRVGVHSLVRIYNFIKYNIFKYLINIQYQTLTLECVYFSMSSTSLLLIFLFPNLNSSSKYLLLMYWWSTYCCLALLRVGAILTNTAMRGTTITNVPRMIMFWLMIIQCLIQGILREEYVSGLSRVIMLFLSFLSPTLAIESSLLLQSLESR